MCIRDSSTIVDLSRCDDNDQLGTVLRNFERSIVKQTGYGISFNTEADGKTAIENQQYYRFHQGRGFVRCTANDKSATLGRIIRSLSNHEQQALSVQEMTQSKHLMRQILHHNLGYKTILSRELFFPRER